MYNPLNNGDKKTRAVLVRKLNAIVELHTANVKVSQIANQTRHSPPTLYRVLRLLKDRKCRKLNSKWEAVFVIRKGCSETWICRRSKQTASPT